MKSFLHTLIGVALLSAGCGDQGPPDPQPTPAGRADTDQSSAKQQEVQQGGAEKTVFLHVRIPEAITPVDRGSKYGDPIGRALASAGLGEVTGGGSALNEDKSIDSVGVDIEVIDVDKAIAIIIEALRASHPWHPPVPFAVQA